MKKRVLAVILAAVLGAMSFSGCSRSEIKLYEQANKDLEQGSYEYALSEFLASVQNEVKVAESYRGAGIAELRLGNYENAVEYFTSALSCEKVGKKLRKDLLEYRASTQYKIGQYENAMIDCQTLAAEYELDADKIALLGESAGAHYAALSAVTSACGAMPCPWAENSAYSDKVQAVIAVYCPADLGAIPGYFAIEKQTMDLDTIIGEFGQADSMEAVYLGGTYAEIPETYAQANPETWISADCPPFLFLHGTRDQVIPVLGAQHFAAKLMQAIGKDNVRFQMVEGAKHDIHDFEQEWIYDLEAEFLREKLGVRK